MKFTTHTDEIIEGYRLVNALNKVADDWQELAHKIRVGSYASHVTENTKDETLQRGLEFAEKIRNGYFDNFTIWQRVNAELTGECVALFNK